MAGRHARDPDPEQAARLKRILTRAGMLGTLAAVLGIPLIGTAYPSTPEDTAPVAAHDVGAPSMESPVPTASASAPTIGVRPRYPNVAVVGHRGAPTFRPQHTLEGYRLAIEQGADLIEPDLVISKDGQLIARHERDLTETTDVRTRPALAGKARGGRWYAEDLTLAEIKTLRALGGPPTFAGKFEIPTLREILEMVRRHPRQVGVYIETKEPQYLRGIGLPMEERLAALLHEFGLNTPTAPVLLQSFDPDSLLVLRNLIDVRRVQLVQGHAPAITPQQLDAYARYAVAIGVHADRLRGYLTTRPPDDRNLVKQAAARGLAVHVYTLDWRNPYGALPASHSVPGDPAQWAEALPLYRALYSLGITAIFTDAPNIAVYARG